MAGVAAAGLPRRAFAALAWVLIAGGLASCAGGNMPAARAADPVPRAVGIAPDGAGHGGCRPHRARHRTCASRVRLYVTPGGSRRSACARRAPCTFRRANALARPGVTVHVAPGRYGTVPALSAPGRAFARVRWVSRARWRAKLTGPVKLSGAYVDLEGFDIRGGKGNGIVWLAATGTRAIGNHVHDLRKRCGDPSGGDGIGFDGGAFGWRSHDQAAIGNFVENIGVGPRDGTCRTISGIYPDTPGNQVLGNIVRNAIGDGISSWHAASGNLIANNTSVDNGGFGILNGSGGNGAVGPNTNTYTLNNIVVGNFRGAITEANAAPDSLFEPRENHYYGNLLWANHGRDLITATNADEVGTVVANPLFVDPAARDYRLRAGSPAIDTGTPYGGDVRDFNGTRRPQGFGFDRGAYERWTRPLPHTSLGASTPPTGQRLLSTNASMFATVRKFSGTMSSGRTSIP